MPDWNHKVAAAAAARLTEEPRKLELDRFRLITTHPEDGRPLKLVAATWESPSEPLNVGRHYIGRLV
jgi:hypothetical protein